jgi:catechol 2,3-dioxygenase-like lactoylglutathione lyase family enzyme
LLLVIAARHSGRRAKGPDWRPQIDARRIEEQLMTVELTPQHYAFLVDEAGFDAILARIRAGGIDHWADPARSRPGEINRYGGARGVYFADPDGHLLEAITRPYPRDLPGDST